MDGKRKQRSWRLAAVTGASTVAVLLVLMAVGLTVGRRGGRTLLEKPGVADKQAESPVSRAEGYRTDRGEGGSAEATPPSAPSGENWKSATGAGTRTPAQGLPEMDVRTIKSGSLNIEIKKGSFEENYRSITTIAESAGGYVSDSHTGESDGAVNSGTVTIRVPSGSFTGVMGELEKLGKVTSRSEQAQDVTEEYVDIESRLRHLRAQESVYLALMARAATIEESIAVQRELSVLQEQIEELTGRKNYLDNRIEFSTISVSLFEEGRAPASGAGWGFIQALSDAVHGVVDGINAVIRGFGYSFIYILMLAGVAAVICYFVRRRRARQGVQATGETGPAGEA